MANPAQPAYLVEIALPLRHWEVRTNSEAIPHANTGYRVWDAITNEEASFETEHGPNTAFHRQVESAEHAERALENAGYQLYEENLLEDTTGAGNPNEDEHVAEPVSTTGMFSTADATAPCPKTPRRGDGIVGASSASKKN